MRIHQYKFLHLIFVFTLALAMQGCVLELGFAAVSQLFAHEHHGHHGQADHHDDAQAPSHKHDNKGQEADFCCDNSFTLLTKAPVPLERIATANASYPSFEDFEKSKLLSSTQFLPHSDFLTSGISGSRDEYALSCLLHAPPLA